MPKQTLATLYTDVVEIREPNTPTEGGQFEMPVIIDTDRFRKEASPRTWFFREIGIHLAQAIADTDVPREFWWIEFSDLAQREFNLPQRQKLAI